MKKIRISLSRRWALVLCSLSALLLTVCCKSSRKVQKSDEQPAMSRIEMQHEADSLQQILDNRHKMLIYGTPDIMRRRAEEDQAIQNRIDSLNNELKKK